MKLPVAQSAIFECFRCAQTTRRGTHACVARAPRPSCTAVNLYCAWPFQQGAKVRGLPLIAPTPFMPTPLTPSKGMHRRLLANSSVHEVVSVEVWGVLCELSSPSQVISCNSPLPASLPQHTAVHKPTMLYQHPRLTNNSPSRVTFGFVGKIVFGVNSFSCPA